MDSNLMTAFGILIMHPQDCNIQFRGDTSMVPDCAPTFRKNRILWDIEWYGLWDLFIYELCAPSTDCFLKLHRQFFPRQWCPWLKNFGRTRWNRICWQLLEFLISWTATYILEVTLWCCQTVHLQEKVNLMGHWMVRIAGFVYSWAMQALCAHLVAHLCVNGLQQYIYIYIYISVVENGQLKVICYGEIALWDQIVLTISDSIVNSIGRPMWSLVVLTNDKHATN